MTNKLVNRVSFRDSDHTYTLEGKRIPSVTGILDNLSKPALPWWAAKVGAQAVVEHLESQMHPVEYYGGNTVVTRSDLPDIFNIVQRAHIDIRNKAGKKGSAVHAAIDAFHTDFFTAEPPTEPDELAAWTAFLEWWNTSGLTALEVERKIVDPLGRYAGRLDLVAQDENSDIYICDVKTSNSVYTGAILQNAAYAHAYESEGEHLVSGTKVLWLPAGCTQLTVVERDRVEWLFDYQIFDSLITLHGYRKGMDAFMKTVNETHKPQPTEDN